MTASDHREYSRLSADDGAFFSLGFSDFFPIITDGAVAGGDLGFFNAFARDHVVSELREPRVVGLLEFCLYECL